MRPLSALPTPPPPPTKPSHVERNAIHLGLVVVLHRSAGGAAVAEVDEAKLRVGVTLLGPRDVHPLNLQATAGEQAGGRSRGGDGGGPGRGPCRAWVMLREGSSQQRLVGAAKAAPPRCRPQPRARTNQPLRSGQTATAGSPRWRLAASCPRKHSSCRRWRRRRRHRRPADPSGWARHSQWWAHGRRSCSTIW